MRAKSAQAHYLLARTARTSGNSSEATRHLTEAKQILAEVRKELGSDDILVRDDLARILSDR